MSFASQLQGFNSHEELLKLQDNEIRWLECVQRCVELWSKAQRDYSASLQKVAAQAAKYDRPSCETPLFQVGYVLRGCCVMRVDSLDPSL